MKISVLLVAAIATGAIAAPGLPDLGKVRIN